MPSILSPKAPRLSCSLAPAGEGTRGQRGTSGWVGAQGGCWGLTHTQFLFLTEPLFRPTSKGGGILSVGLGCPSLATPRLAAESGWTSIRICCPRKRLEHQTPHKTKHCCPHTTTLTNAPPEHLGGAAVARRGPAPLKGNSHCGVESSGWRETPVWGLRSRERGRRVNDQASGNLFTILNQLTVLHKETSDHSIKPCENQKSCC